MKVQRLFLRNVRNIKSLDLDFRNPFTGKPMSRVVLAGANGSGKTTILESVFDLLVAVARYEFNDFPIPTYFNKGFLQLIFEVDYPDSPSVNLSIAHDEENDILKNSRFDQKTNIIENRYTNDLFFIGPRVNPQKELSDNSRFTELNVDIRLADAHKDIAPGNIVFFPHDRFLPAVQQGQSSIENERTIYQWTYKYEASNKWKGSIESYLVWLNYLDLEAYRDHKTITNRFSDAVKLVNTILDGKRIAKVVEGRVIVETEKGETHGLGELSSGEKQLTLLLIEIQRRIVPGSAIVIDEPEISLHPAWQRGLVVALDKIIEQYNAQVILATHSKEIADMVLPHEVLFLSDLNAPAGEWKPEQEVIA